MFAWGLEETRVFLSNHRSWNWGRKCNCNFFSGNALEPSSGQGLGLRFNLSSLRSCTSSFCSLIFLIYSGHVAVLWPPWCCHHNSWHECIYWNTICTSPIPTPTQPSSGTAFERQSDLGESQRGSDAFKWRGT